MILLDTNVLSELMRSEPSPLVERWFLMNEENCCLASVVLAELAFGIAKLDDGNRKSLFQSQLNEWRMRFAQRTYVLDVDAAFAYGDILARARREGRPMSLPDAQIAAIATVQSFELATRNIKDFETTQIKVVNPWL